MSELPHLRLQSTAASIPYTHAGGGGSGEFRLPPRDRLPHAHQLRLDIQQAQTQEQVTRVAQGLVTPASGTVISVRSEVGFELKIDSLERVQSGIELLGVKTEESITIAKVFVPSGKFSRLLALVDAYEQKLTKKGLPRNRELVESIASIRLAAVRDLWQDESVFPDSEQDIWWEVWLRAGPSASPDEIHSRFSDLATAGGMTVSQRFVAFPERVVTLAYGRHGHFGDSLDIVVLVAELRKAKELATSYRELSPRDQGEFVAELASRVIPPPDDAPAVCILDTGVNRAHPLIAPVLAPEDTQTVTPEWGSADDSRQHGTEMAGIAAYGCLTEALSQGGAIQHRHRLESVRILPPPPEQNAPRDYGPFTMQAVSLSEIQAPNRDRAICLAVTADHRDLGMPSLWSATLDQVAAGVGDDRKRLFVVAAGNLRHEIHDPAYEYHSWNRTRGGIEDPAQAWNALTIGAFTDKVVIEHPDFAGWQPLAQAGDLCPTSRTSLPWPSENQDGWPIKPDVVLEGGNYATNGSALADLDDLSLLTTVLPPYPNEGRLLETTRDTSPATAAAARMAAVIWSYYPGLWPETVRGLIVHSARWTDRMTERFPGSSKTAVQQRLRCYGYGVPRLGTALWSAENAATLVFEGDLSPFRKGDDGVRSNEMHVHTLPWPRDVLLDLGSNQVTLRVTLSYFIEPSPGRVGWTRKHRYQSHGLRFDVNRPLEPEDAFRQRLSREEWDDPEVRPVNVEETRDWLVGGQGRRKGSVHSDSWTGNAAELATSNLIAVHPVTGWWRERPHLQRFGSAARYSLIVTIESDDVGVDLYTPIAAHATVMTELNV